jgi:hypothetical protein
MAGRYSCRSASVIGPVSVQVLQVGGGMGIAGVVRKNGMDG